MKRLIIIISSIVLVVTAGAFTLGVIKIMEPAKQKISDNQSSDTPDFTATPMVSGLDHPWDIDFLPSGTLLFSERSGDISLVKNSKKVLLESPADIEAVGEGGLLGIAVDPEFEQNKFIYACLNSTRGDIRVARWTADETTEILSGRSDILTGIPASNSGRHSGCQLAFGPDGNLWVGTGDAADESQPQDRNTLGGKILRLTRDGKAAEGNPEGPDERVYSYGHRNLQAIAFYESQTNGSYGLSVEHGSDRDDEVNELKPGNFGWAPGRGYDESASMTDTARFPDAIQSVWSSGNPTIAPSGAVFLEGKSWGRLQGWLAVSVLKDQKLLLLNVTNGSVSGERTLFKSEYGRLRAATIGPDGNLYISTDNGTNDAIYRVTPKQR